MNMQELQDRVNAIVQRVNNYEADLEKTNGNETELLSEHKYCDIHCLRAVYDWITGCDSSRKANTTLNSTVNGRLYSFDNYHRMDNTFSEFEFYDLFYNTNNLNSTSSYTIEDEQSMYSYTACAASNGNDDLMAIYNLKYLGGRYDKNYTSPPNPAFISENSQYAIGWNNLTGVNIADALITESQVVNLYNVNYIQLGYSSNTQNAYDIWDASVVNHGGIWLLSPETNTSTGSPISISGDRLLQDNWDNSSFQFGYIDDNNVDVSVGNNFQLKAFIPDYSFVYANENTYCGFKFGSYFSNANASVKKVTTNSQPAGQTYFELAFKRRRAGCKAAGLDFIPTLDTVMDNDPQGLATRFALAQCKPYYRGRPWWSELDELYTENGEYQAKLADAILEASENMNDLEYLQNYKLDYETVANVMEWPL